MTPGTWVRQRGDGRREKGAAAVEFALICVLFLTLLLGMIQYSMYFLSTQSSAAAAREAARRAAVGDQTCVAMQAAAANNVRLASGAVTAKRAYYRAADTGFTTPVTTVVGGDNVKVTISYNSVDMKFPFVPFVTDGAVVSSAFARVENPTSNTVPCS